MGSPVEGAPCYVSDICAAPGPGRVGQPAPLQSGILDVEIASSNSLRVSISPLDMNFEDDLAEPDKLGKLRSRGSNRSSQRHAELKPRLASRPQSSVPSISRTLFGKIPTFIFL